MVDNIALGLGSVLTGDGDSVKDVAIVEKRKNLNGKRERESNSYSLSFAINAYLHVAKCHACVSK